MKAKLSLSRRTPAEKLALGRSIVSKMTANNSFPNPIPTMSDLTTALDNLEVALIEAADGGRSKLSVRRQRVAELDNLLRRLSLWVENVADGNESLILSVGLEVKRAASPIGLPLMPEGLRASLPGPHGMVYLSWKAVKGAYTYELQMLQGDAPNGDWTKLTNLTRSFYMVEGLASGQQYWFRVSATGTAGTSGWSDPATVFAP